MDVGTTILDELLAAVLRGEALPLAHDGCATGVATRAWWIRVLLAGAAGTLLSCGSLSGGARDTFANLHYCPPERVTLREVTVPCDDKPVNGTNEPLVLAQLAQLEGVTPSDEVSADPDRLRFWQQQHAKALAKMRSEAEGLRRQRLRYCSPEASFEVSGCGHTEILGCQHQQHSSNHVSYVSCSVERASSSGKPPPLSTAPIQPPPPPPPPPPPAPSRAP
jgi:hypothetical protein